MNKINSMLHDTHQHSLIHLYSVGHSMTIITYALIGGVAGGGSLLVVCITLISSVAIISVCTKRGI